MSNHGFIFNRPGGELNPGEDEVEGLKRLMTEVRICSFVCFFSLRVKLPQTLYGCIYMNEDK